MEVVVKALVEVEVNYYSGLVGGWSDKTKLILISTLVEVVVEVEVELGNNINHNYNHNNYENNHNFNWL